jgi:hypothetical protein
MATDVKHTTEANSTSSVVAEIIRDGQELFNQQLAMFKTEINEDIRKTQNALYPLAWGMGVAAIGGVLLSLMLVHFVHWATPLYEWAAYGVVGLIMTAAGLGIFFAGKKKMESLHPLPEKSAEALKENLQWLTQPK